MFPRTELGEIKALSTEMIDKINVEPLGQDLQMIMELLESGSNEEKRRLAQALLDIGRQV